MKRLECYSSKFKIKISIVWIINGLKGLKDKSA